MINKITSCDFLRPGDLAMCQRIFDQLRIGPRGEPASASDQLLAMSVITLFQQGITDETELLRTLRARRNNS
jgi:hypothetical protein